MYSADPVKVLPNGLRVRRFASRGTGGVNGVKSVPNVLLQKYRRIFNGPPALTKSAAGGGGIKRKCTGSPQAKNSPGAGGTVRKKRRLYAVSKSRFFAEGSVDALRSALAACAVADYAGREAVFAAHREAVQTLLRAIKECAPESYSNWLESVPSGFWADVLHCGHQLEWLMAGLSVVESIRTEVHNQFRCLRAVLQVPVPLFKTATGPHNFV
jgi:hypothetical protein